MKFTCLIIAVTLLTGCSKESDDTKSAQLAGAESESKGKRSAEAAEAPSPAAKETQVPSADETVKAFCEVFLKGDFAGMASFYADEVLLEKNSEFLKPRWGILSEDDVREARTVSREQLMGAYTRFIAKIGDEKWQKVMGKVSKDQISVTPENGMEHLAIQTGHGDDTLHFKFRYNTDAAKWQIAAEKTDY
jgi:hypothetical protein